MGTLIVGLILLGCVCAVITKLIRDKKSGNNCLGCSSCSLCCNTCHVQDCRSKKGKNVRSC